MSRRTILAVGAILAIAVATFFTTKIIASQSGMPGTIVAVNSVDKTIGVIDAGKISYAFQCTDNTTYTLNGFAASFNQMAAGQSVEVQYEPDTFIAIHIDARTQ